MAQDITAVISRPFDLDGHEVFVTTSIGIAVRPPSEAGDMVKDADTAVYRAKQSGRNTYRFYTEEMNIQVFERLAFENSLRRALEREEFLLYYQPQVDLASGELVAVEALLRWQHPDLGLVSPARFIPVLEDTGLIVPVGEWVLRTACHQARAWRDSGLKPTRMAVNLSSRQFGQADLVGSVASVLEETGLDPRYLELEITKSLIMEDVEASSRALAEFKETANGIRVSIDDFGTGYSSLFRLKTFPIDLLKIDRSFVRDITTDPDDAAITAAMIGLAHELRLEVIAEGVETEEQLSFLRARGCDLVQGYYLSRPLPAADITELLKREAKDGRLIAVRPS